MSHCLRFWWRGWVRFGRLATPGETEASAAGEQLAKGYVGEAHRNDAQGRGTARSTLHYHPSF